MNQQTTVTKAMVAGALGQIVMFAIVSKWPEAKALEIPVSTVILGALTYFVPHDAKIAGLGVILAGFVLASMLASCSVQYKGWSSSLLQFVPADVVQTGTRSVIGIDLAPMGTEGPSIRVGYVRSQTTAVPGFDPGTYVPDVSATTKVDAESGAFIEETLDVSTLEAAPDLTGTADPGQ